MNIVVTGGAGFIGANLCRRLASEQHNVTAFDNLSTGHRSNLLDLPAVDLVEGDILDSRAIRNTLSHSDVVVHLAARPSVPRSIADPVASHETNVTGTLNVLEAARAAGVRQVLFASSSSVYGSNRQLPTSEHDAPAPISPYAATKLAAESYVLAWQKTFSIPALAFRFFNVYGPLQSSHHDYAAVVPRFLSAALSDSPLPIYGDGNQTRDFTFVGTVVDILADAVRRGLAFDGPINLAFGARTSLLELIAILESLLRRTLVRTYLPVRPGDVADSCASNENLQELFPHIRPTTLPEGLRTTLQWFTSVDPLVARKRQAL